VSSTEPSKDKKSRKKNDIMYIKKQTMGPFKVVSLLSRRTSSRKDAQTQTTPSPYILKRSKHAEPTSTATLQTLEENTTDSNTSLAAVWEKACDVTLQRAYENGRAFS
jgi:hypothetical protein